MKCKVLHESSGRMRVHMFQKHMTLDQADLLEYYLAEKAGIVDVKVYDRTADCVIRYSCERKQVVDYLASFTYEKAKALDIVPATTGRKLNKEFEEKLYGTVIGHYAVRVLMPLPLRWGWNVLKAIPYVKSGLKCLAQRKIEVPVLDATAVSVALMTGDYGTASSIMFLLKIGEILEDWTHKKSVDDLARRMSLDVEQVWLKKDDTEVLLPVNQIEVGDEIVVRTGNLIPLDGVLVSGEAMVNQASMTGESTAVHKKLGNYVYAGTVVEEGSCVIKVEKANGSGRYDRIVKMIEESEKLKSATEDKFSHLADKLVPYSLGATALTYLVTRNITKVLAILMVDFSCALKLAMPISVLSAMREATDYHISVKGGKFLEAVSEADTIVFDKTGTLTYADTKVVDVVTFGGNDAKEMLRLAACLEEHYPHTIANAVVNEAAAQGLNHEEIHSTVEYVVAHGISSFVGEKRVLIGSYHFVFEDEGVEISEEEMQKFEGLPEEYSHLYLAIDGHLAAVLLIADPLREEAHEVIAKLHELGIGRVVMMTGDNEHTARAIAGKVGVDDFFAGVLPEDKAAFIRREHAKGRKVIMVGDGVNDSPALSEADAGVAISTGAAIAKEIADITISAGDLNSLVNMKLLSNALMKRINSNYRTIISFNLGLIILGVAGILPPSTTALLHNASTITISLHSMTDLIKNNE